MRTWSLQRAADVFAWASPKQGHWAARATFLLGSALISPAWAVIPESGLYVALGRPGEAWLVEHQNGRVAAILVSYRLDRQPEFYFASGNLMKGPVDTNVMLNGDEVGHTLRARLKLARGDVPMGLLRADPLLRSVQAREIGDVELEFVHAGVIELTIERDDTLQIIAPDDVSLTVEQSQLLFRFNFGYDSYGQISPTSGVECSQNRAGEWVVVDESDPALPPWRFHFVLTSPVVPGCDRALPPIEYVDVARAARMVCSRDNDCAVTQQGQPLFFFHHLDVGLTRMVGSRGARPGGATVRTQHTVLATRIDSSGQQP